MKRLSVLVVVLVLTGYSAFSSTGDDGADNRVPLICFPEHAKLPCTAGAEAGHAYRFNLLTHCGIEWAYFNGHYWVPESKVYPPPDWAGIEAGTMILEQKALPFSKPTREAVRFVPATASYNPPDCE